MGSMSSPYNSYYKDCSTGICSIYCPQWCYIVFPPPPPFAPEDDSGTNFSPLVIAVIGILASAFLLIAYYTLISKYCRRRRSGGGDHQNPVLESESTNLSHTHHDQWQPQSTSGLDQALIESITVCCYRKGDGLVEGTECAVCLSEFEENEKIRLLPKCSHAFHLPCIDMWLKSHSNCPLCRANVISGAYPLPQSDPIVQNSSNSNVSSLQVHPHRDLIVVVEDPERVYRTEEIVEDGENDSEKFRRSASLGSFPYRGNLLVSDILQIREDDDEIEMVIHQLPVEIGSSRGICPRNSMEIGRSISAGGRFSCTMHDKGKNSVNPD